MQKMRSQHQDIQHRVDQHARLRVLRARPPPGTVGERRRVFVRGMQQVHRAAPRAAHAANVLGMWLAQL